MSREYTAEEMRKAAKSMTYGDDESSMEFVVAEAGDNLTFIESVEETNIVAAMLRQAADAKEELAKAKRPDACPANSTNKMCYLPGEYCCDTVRYLQKENVQLKARLEAVAKECERIMNVPIGQIDNINMQQARYNVAYAILSLARGAAGKEERWSKK